MIVVLPDAPIETLEQYLATDVGGKGLLAAQDLGPQGVIDTIMASGLRGRGGGGFPTGRKWSGIVSQRASTRYLVANGAEGEPGTFKDRMLLRRNPYQFVEGLMIAAYAIDAAQIFVCVKASFVQEVEILARVVQEFHEAEFGDGRPITIVQGPDEYLFGEEKAMLEVIEGKPPLPRWFAPYEHGLFASSPQSGWEAGPHGDAARSNEPNPTVVNNVETLANVTAIVARGADWFRSLGTEESPGTIIVTVTGDVERPGVAEVEMGTSLRHVIDTIGGGVGDGRSVKAVFSGVANAVITAEHLDAPLSYEGLQAIGSGLGSAGFIVYDDRACMVEIAYQYSRFLSVESCGQCPPCKMGSGEITVTLGKLEAGTADAQDIETMRGWLLRVTDGNRCYLPVEEQIVISSILDAFADEVVVHLQTGTCPVPVSRPMPKLIDIAESGVTYDESFWRKRPDWTYADEPF